MSEPGRGLSRGSTDACGCGAYAPLRAGGECRLCFGAAPLPAAKAAATSNSSQLHEFSFDSDYNPQPTAAPSRAECESHEYGFDSDYSSKPTAAPSRAECESHEYGFDSDYSRH